MKALSIFFGIILAIFGVSLLCTPLLTYLSIGYYMAILLLAYGVVGLITAIALKKYGRNLAFSILSLIGGIALLVLPGLMAFTEMMGVFIMAAWFVIQGAMGIAGCVAAKRNGRPLWWLILVFGIIGVLVGLYSFCHPLMSAFATGILVAIYFIQAGINMCFMPDTVA